MLNISTAAVTMAVRPALLFLFKRNVRLFVYIILGLVDFIVLYIYIFFFIEKVSY